MTTAEKKIVDRFSEQAVKDFYLHIEDEIIYLEK
jgi:hypothetical protein